MKIIPILLEKEETIRGTNCSNCIFYNGKIIEANEDNLDSQGGGKLTSKEDIDRVKEADLITMPGKGKPEELVMCTHPKVKVYVSERQCCAFWDAKGTYRVYGEQIIGK